MPLQDAKAPDAVGEIAGRELERLRAAVPPEERERTVFSLGDAYPVYRATLQGFAEGSGLATATLNAWRQLISIQQAPAALLEVSTGKDGSSYRFAQINHGPFVEATVRTLAVAERSERNRAGDYEVRLLQVAALYLMAVWLSSTQTTEDILLPVAPAPDPLIANREYTTREFEQILQELARIRLAESDETKGAGG